MRETFKWSPALGGQGDMTFAVRSSKFGGGYEQRIEDGINNVSETYQLTFRGRVETIREIRSFLRRHAGVRAFDWTPPIGEPGRFVCKKLGHVFSDKTVFVLTATFDQDFGV
jgi:phage-related protein